MQGGIAQTIGLVFAANAKLRGLQGADWPDGSIYSFCKKVGFVGRKRKGILSFGRQIRVADPNEWLRTLPADAERAQLNVFARGDPSISDRESVGFSGGGPVFVAQVLAASPEAWHGEWRVSDQSDLQNRIWSVKYRNIADVPSELPGRHSTEVREVAP